ncbi:hypothetical protein MAH1_21490 [Sessilibacter sp. MAH1]
MVNNFSYRYKRFKSSAFYSRFTNKIRIIGPVELEANGTIMIADCDLPRKEQERVKKYVFSKYNIKRGIMIDFPQNTIEYKI